MQEKYDIALGIMHWLTGMLIIIMLAMGFYMKLLSDDYWAKPNIYALHKSIGITLLFLLIARITRRCISVIPEYPGNFPHHLIFMSKVTHIGLYAASLTMATSGYIMSSASGKAIKMFSFNIPLLIDVNKSTAIIAGQCHGICAYLLSTIIVSHILAALKHKFIDKDNIF